MSESAEQSKPRPKYIAINRSQGRFCDLMIDHLVGDEHPVRMIWELVGKLDLSAFEKEVASYEKQVGRAAWSPQVLISVLAYGYTLGTGSAREIERRMGHEPGLRWLVGMETINHHTLSDFRRQDEEKLKGIFTQVLALLASEEVLDFQTLVQDGTKMRAQASTSSMRRRKTLSEHLKEAKTCVEELDRQAEQETSRPKPTKKETAQKRAAREKLKRMEAALEELEKRETAAPAAEKEKTRVSETEPEVKKMKHADGAFAPSYNLQLVAEAQVGFIVGWTVSTSCNDQHQLLPGLEMAVNSTGQMAKTMIADGGYAYRHNIEELAKRGVELVAPRLEEDKRHAGALAKAGIAPEFGPGKFTKAPGEDTMYCPAGQPLVQVGTGTHHGEPVVRYQAQASACQSCPHKPKCCPKKEARAIERVVESQAVRQHERRMGQPEIQELYKKRKQIGEYPFLRTKSDWRMTRFRLRGRANVNKESFWMVLAFNFDRLHWRRRQRVAATQPIAA